MTRIVDSDLVGVIDWGEDATLEFKRPLTKDIGRSCVRALTRAAGPSWSASRMLGELSAWGTTPAEIAGAAHRPPAIDVEVESVGEILRVAVPPQERKPYSFGGRFFMRDGTSSRQKKAGQDGPEPNGERLQDWGNR